MSKLQSLLHRNLTMYTHRNRLRLLAIAVGVPLVSASRYHKLDMHIPRALTCQTRVCKPRRLKFYFYMHLCKSSMPILIPTIPGPRPQKYHGNLKRSQDTRSVNPRVRHAFPVPVGQEEFCPSLINAKNAVLWNLLLTYFLNKRYLRILSSG